ncbi:hypothetical protein [Actinomadura harenae]|uniref:hypothetical protein n=1 Tax=Actinomadura harenae TaxID=2483351 RepID=UPI0011C44C15|nr:hypothetical protein [Actinomadura harenae]
MTLYKKPAAASGADTAKPSWVKLCSPRGPADATKERACVRSAGTPENHDEFSDPEKGTSSRFTPLLVEGACDNAIHDAHKAASWKRVPRVRD